MNVKIVNKTNIIVLLLFVVNNIFAQEINLTPKIYEKLKANYFTNNIMEEGEYSCTLSLINQSDSVAKLIVRNNLWYGVFKGKIHDKTWIFSGDFYIKDNLDDSLTGVFIKDTLYGLVSEFHKNKLIRCFRLDNKGNFYCGLSSLFSQDFFKYTFSNQKYYISAFNFPKATKENPDNSNIHYFSTNILKNNVNYNIIFYPNGQKKREWTVKQWLVINSNSSLTNYFPFSDSILCYISKTKYDINNLDTLTLNKICVTEFSKKTLIYWYYLYRHQEMPYIPYTYLGEGIEIWYKKSGEKQMKIIYKKDGNVKRIRVYDKHIELPKKKDIPYKSIKQN